MIRSDRCFQFWCVLPALALLAAADAPKAIDLPNPRQFPESVAIGPGGYAYVGSAGSGGVARVSLKTGKVEPFIPPGGYGTRSIFGVMADPKHNRLWVCSNDMGAAGVSIPEPAAPTSISGFDLRTGEGKISLPLPGTAPFCNDSAVAGDGTLYVTDTAGSQVLRWKPGATALEVWKTDPAFKPTAPFTGLDGIAFGGDGNLYVDKLSGELFRISMKDGAVTKLTPSRALVRPDAIRPIGGMRFLLVDQNRVSRMTISGDNADISALADADEATGADVDGGTAWYVQGHLSFLFRPANPPQTPPLPFRLSAVRIGQ